MQIGGGGYGWGEVVGFSRGVFAVHEGMAFSLTGRGGKGWRNGEGREGGGLGLFWLLWPWVIDVVYW